MCFGRRSAPAALPPPQITRDPEAEARASQEAGAVAANNVLAATRRRRSMSALETGAGAQQTRLGGATVLGSIVR